MDKCSAVLFTVLELRRSQMREGVGRVDSIDCVEPLYEPYMAPLADERPLPSGRPLRRCERPGPTRRYGQKWPAVRVRHCPTRLSDPHPGGLMTLGFEYGLLLA